MTEISRDKLEGETVAEKDQKGYQTQISDLESYMRERQGLPNPELIIEGESLVPRSVVPKNIVDYELVDSDFGGQTVNLANLKHDDSALAKSIHKSRLEKKAA